MTQAAQLKRAADIKVPPQAILIVEDDQLLRMLTSEIVEEAGLVAVEAPDADEALAILSARSDIAMVLTDVNMPGSMDGIELARVVRERWPHIKIIVVSARTNIAATDLPGECGLFHKPYRPAEMISAIHALMDAGDKASAGCAC